MVCFIWEDTQRLFIFTGNLAHDRAVQLIDLLLTTESHLAGITSTGHGASRMIRSLTLPMNNFVIRPPLRPEMMITSAASAFANATMRFPGLPSSTFILTLTPRRSFA
jgi:hypothetical protein